MPDESLYPHVTGFGHAFFWCYNESMAEKVRAILVSAKVIEVPLAEPAVVCFLSDDMESLLPILEAKLSSEECRTIRALLSSKAHPDLCEFGAMQSLRELGLRLTARWLGDMLADRRYKSLMQPIVSANDHSDVLGYEFLIRGLHTDGSEITAPALFETAEEAGMLHALDLAAGESALRTAKRFDIKENIFVNVLPYSVESEDGLNNWLNAVLGKTDFPHEQLVFEIVESQQLPDFETLQRLVSRLKDQGIRIALDDFGTGFNNLATLTQIQPDYIKLDKSLTRGLIEDGRKWTLVANIVDSATQSNIKVIAEGVEDEKTARMLESAGVEYLQGYLFGYPADTPL